MSILELGLLAAAIAATLYQVVQVAKIHAVITLGRGMLVGRGLYLCAALTVAVQVIFVAVVTR